MSTKILNSVDSNNTLESGSTVNLSNKSLSHRFSNDKISKLSFKQYANKEFTLVLGEYPTKQVESTLKLTKKPPQREKELIQKGISQKQAGTIRRTVRILHYLSPNSKLSFLTLTYGKNYPDDRTAKKHLDNFIKRLKRNHFEGENFHYVWVAEKQKRGALHYHIVLIDYIPKKIIDKAWNGVVQKWQKKNGFDTQVVYPNIVGLESSKGAQQYLTKTMYRIGGYMTAANKQDTIQEIDGHIWNRSTITAQACKPTLTDIREDEIFINNEELYDETLELYENNSSYEVYQIPITDCSVKILVVKPIGIVKAKE